MAGLVVDLDARTITGVAVPYGRVARSGGRRYRFLPGWACYTTVRLLIDHDYGQWAGRATAVADTPDGLGAIFTAFPGPVGDRALALAADARYGLSVGPWWRQGDVQPDPDDPTVRLVTGGDLPEISLTRHPAF